MRLSFQDLTSSDPGLDLSRELEQAFGLDGFGAVIVTDAPGLRDLRAQALRGALELSEQPQSVLDEVTCEDMTGPAGVGWSVEKMNSPFGKSSRKFVSFFSRYPDEQVTFSPDPALERASRNLWPSALPHLQRDLNALHAQMVPAVLGLLPHLDGFLSRRIAGYPAGRLTRRFRDHYQCVNRLIVYSPLEDFDDAGADQFSWDHWHTDFSLFAALVHPIYLDRAGEVRDLDCTAYALRDRRGEEHQVVFSEDEFIITTGDALVIESAGYVPATPHTVRIPPELPKDVRRLQSVSFIDPLFEHRMRIPTGESFAEIIARDPGRYAHRAVDSFEDGCYFKEFYEELLRFLYK